MKYRADFVTNSSSSSFILCFDNEKDVSKFQSLCEEYDYETFYKLIEYSASDFIKVCSTVDDCIKLNPILDLIRKYNMSKWVSEKIDEVYMKDLSLKPYESVIISLYNPFVDGVIPENYDISNLNLDEIDTDEYYVCLINQSENREKSEAIREISYWKSIDYSRGYIKEHCPQRPNEKYNDYVGREIAFRETDDYKNAIADYVETTDVPEMRDRINKAYMIVRDTIWDSQGGLIEWAIRNGFIQSEFRKYLIYQMNIG